MKLGLFRYATSFICDCSLEEATKRIFETVLCEDNNLEVVRACYDGVQRLTLDSSTGSYIYHNSFMPIINIDIEESDGRALIHILFELKQRTKVFMLLFLYDALVLIGFLIFLYFNIQLETIIPLFFIFVIIILGITISVTVLRFSAKGVLRTLYEALTGESDKALPSIHKPDYFK